jgi:hypothetical protein
MLRGRGTIWGRSCDGVCRVELLVSNLMGFSRGYVVEDDV